MASIRYVIQYTQYLLCSVAELNGPLQWLFNADAITKLMCLSNEPYGVTGWFWTLAPLLQLLMLVSYTCVRLYMAYYISKSFALNAWNNTWKLQYVGTPLSYLIRHPRRVGYILGSRAMGYYPIILKIQLMVVVLAYLVQLYYWAIGSTAYYVIVVYYSASTCVLSLVLTFISWPCFAFAIWLFDVHRRADIAIERYSYHFFRIECMRLKGRKAQLYASEQLRTLNLRQGIEPAALRAHFMNTPIPSIKPDENHSHGPAAADRSSAGAFADTLASLAGLVPYYVQRSRADERKNREGSRSWYWGKDVTSEPTPFVFSPDQLQVYVDVDQYLDMPRILVEEYGPKLIYTFQPHAVARVGDHHRFTFNEDNTVQYYVTGGGRFKHAVWNWSLDNLLICVEDDIGMTVATYLVDRRITSPDHELVLLTPTGFWKHSAGRLASHTLSGPNLRRLRVVTEDKMFTRLLVNATENVTMSTGRVGQFISANIPVVQDDALAVTVRTSKYDLMASMVKGVIGDTDQTTALILLEYHRAQRSHVPDVVCPIAEAVRRYQFGKFEPDAKPSLLAFMNPIINDAFSPDQTLGNEQECIAGRITKFQPNTIVPTAFLLVVMREFAEMLVPQPHQLHPMDVDAVYDQQNRPTQRRILENAEYEHTKRVAKMFVKKEAYGKPTSPRPITTINGNDKRDYSRYCYALAEHLKSQQWYAFGISPAEISRRVVKVCRGSRTHVTNSDFSRFDGHGSNVMRDLEQLILMRAFPPTYHAQLNELHRSQFGLKGVSTFGTKYETHYARLSGSPETSLFNSILNAFVGFYALRMTRKAGSFYTKEEAYTALGIYGGDDGLTADIPNDIYLRAATTMGQELAIEPIQRGRLGVKFLARIYGPDVWFGDDSSVCDLRRQLSKFHTTVAMPSNVTPSMKLIEKARAYYVSDRNTPIIGPYVRKVMQLSEGLDYKIVEEQRRLIVPWTARFDASDQYNNDPRDWYAGYAQLALPDADVKRWQRYLADIIMLDNCLAPPTIQAQTDPVVTNRIVLDGEYVGKRAPQGEKESFETLKARKQAAGTWVERSARPDSNRTDRKVPDDKPMESKYPMKRPTPANTSIAPIATSVQRVADIVDTKHTEQRKRPGKLERVKPATVTTKKPDPKKSRGSGVATSHLSTSSPTPVSPPVAKKSGATYRVKPQPAVVPQKTTRPARPSVWQPKAVPPGA